MKTEKQIKDGIDKVKESMLKMVDSLANEIEAEEYYNASETCFSIMANVCALEAAVRILNNE